MSAVAIKPIIVASVLRIVLNLSHCNCGGRGGWFAVVCFAVVNCVAVGGVKGSFINILGKLIVSSISITFNDSNNSNKNRIEITIMVITSVSRL